MEIDVLHKSESVICRQFVLDYIENYLLLTYRLIDFLRSNNHNLIVEALQALNYFLNLIVVDADYLIDLYNPTIKGDAIISKI